MQGDNGCCRFRAMRYVVILKAFYAAMMAALLGVGSGVSRAAEVDNYTTAGRVAVDSTALLNGIFSQTLHQVIAGDQGPLEPARITDAFMRAIDNVPLMNRITHTVPALGRPSPEGPGRSLSAEHLPLAAFLFAPFHGRGARRGRGSDRARPGRLLSRHGL